MNIRTFSHILKDAPFISFGEEDARSFLEYLYNSIKDPDIKRDLALLYGALTSKPAVKSNIKRNKRRKGKPKHYRALKVKYLGNSVRIKLIDEQFGESKIIDYCDQGGNMLCQAIKFLLSNGFNVVGHGEMKDCYIIFCDNWGDECVTLKSIK